MKIARVQFPCEACEQETHFQFLRDGLCPRCHIVNRADLNIRIEGAVDIRPPKNRTIH